MIDDGADKVEISDISEGAITPTLDEVDQMLCDQLKGLSKVETVSQFDEE
jgi:hypothetical protein